MIDESTKQEIMDAACIDDVVGEFVSLKKRGSRFLGLCPFHNEKTPSFTVTPRLGIFKCFGCGKGGDAVTFLMEHEKLSYPEALKFLAKKYNIKVREEAKSSEQVEAEKEEESLLNLTEFAAAYFAHNLFNTEQGRAIGLSYFKERGFREDTIKKFRLGYAPDGSSSFTDHALKNGYSLDMLKKTGLTKDRGTGPYDGFRGRVMFPIFNHLGRVIAFTGRTLSSDKKVPKYVNSTESAIFHKSKALYGINLAKGAMSKHDNCLLVEGNTDVVSMVQEGFENVVASSGTSLTTDQIRLIRRYTKNITIIYDGDPAGIKAAFRGVDMILEEGMDVKIILLPEGEDPDSFVRQNRHADVEKFLREKKQNFILFKTGLLLDEAHGDPMKMASLTREIVTSIALIPDRIIQSYYVKACSELLKISEDTLMHELNLMRKKRYDKKVKDHQREASAGQVPLPDAPGAHPQQPPAQSYDVQERELIRILMKYPEHTIRFVVSTEKKDETWDYSVAKYIVNDLQRDQIQLTKPVYQKVLAATSEHLESGQVPTSIFYTHHPDKEISALAADLLSERYQLSRWEQISVRVKDEGSQLADAVTHALLLLKLRYLEKKYDDNLNRLKKANPDEETEILKSQVSTRRKINILSSRLNVVVF